MGELMGRNEYARHRGCAPNAVSKAIASGRIKAAVVYDAAGRFEGIRWQQADALWAQNTDPVEAARNGKFYDAPAPVVAIPPGMMIVKTPAVGWSEQPPIVVPAVAPAGELDLGEPGATSGAAPGAVSSVAADNNAGYLAARTLKEQFAAKSAELDYLKTIGRLVDAAAVRHELMEVLNQLKTSALRIPDRKAQALAAETDPARVNRILSDELRSVFDECSRQFADDAAGGVEERASVSP